MSTAIPTPIHLVVPCYNEAQRFALQHIAAYLVAQPQVHLILVDDGSQDDTKSLLWQLHRRLPEQVQVIEFEGNRGKAEAVRVGLQAALARDASMVGYWDADLATPLSALASFETLLRTRPELELVIGARVALLGRHIERRLRRHYLGRVFATAASLVLHLPIYDTQCGAKLLRVNPRTSVILAAPFHSRWIFDVELIARLLVSGTPATAIYELPLLEWRDVGESRVLASDYLRAAFEILSIWRRYPQLRQRDRRHA